MKEKGLRDAVSPSAVKFFLPPLNSRLSSLLSPRPNVINWHVTLEAGVCMYSLHPRLLPLYYVCSIQLSFQVSGCHGRWNGAMREREKEGGSAELGPLSHFRLLHLRVKQLQPISPEHFAQPTLSVPSSLPSPVHSSYISPNGAPPYSPYLNGVHFREQ